MKSIKALTLKDKNYLCVIKTYFSDSSYGLNINWLLA